MARADSRELEFVERLAAVDLHAGGLPGRVVISGLPDIRGSSMLEKATYLQAHMDGLRQLMLNEPRGYPASCCNFVLPSANADADLGVVIMEHVEYPSMSGSNTLYVATAAVELGLVEVSEPVTRFTLEAPAGLVDITARVENGKAVEVTFRNVPAFAVYLDAPLTIPGYGTVTVDIAWGGMFYVIAGSEEFGLSLSPHAGREIARVGRMLTLAASEQLP